MEAITSKSRWTENPNQPVAPEAHLAQRHHSQAAAVAALAQYFLRYQNFYRSR
jgi:hypothetical protein